MSMPGASAEELVDRAITESMHVSRTHPEPFLQGPSACSKPPCSQAIRIYRAAAEELRRSAAASAGYKVQEDATGRARSRRRKQEGGARADQAVVSWSCSDRHNALRLRGHTAAAAHPSPLQYTVRLLTRERPRQLHARVRARVGKIAAAPLRSARDPFGRTLQVRIGSTDD